EKSDWDKESVSQMIYDNDSPVAVNVVKDLLSGIGLTSKSALEKEAIASLTSWKGSHNTQDVAPTIYNKWVYLYLKYTFEDEMGAENFKVFLGTHIGKQVI